MAFWLDRGVVGFRVDMAYSLVKGDPDREATAALWRDLSGWLHETYPDAVLLPESDIEAPVDLGLRSGFDGDFFLVNQAAHSALSNNGGAGSLWWLPDHEHCFFDADGPDGPGSLGRFLTLWDEHIAGNGPDRRVVLATADHDYSRLHSGDRGLEQLPAAYAFLLTWGTVPSIYYGDEIGMRYLPGLPDLEGSVCYPGYNRAGCRTPMQWDGALPNTGFSDAAPERLYLPQDPDPHHPTVAAQLADPRSLLHVVPSLLALRATHRPWRRTSPRTRRSTASCSRGFVDGRGGRWSTRLGSSAAVRAAGPPEGTTTHDLRHQYASVLLAAGESVVAVAERLGHGDATLVLTTYGHLLPDSKIRTRRAVDDAWCALDVPPADEQAR